MKKYVYKKKMFSKICIKVHDLQSQRIQRSLIVGVHKNTRRRYALFPSRLHVSTSVLRYNLSFERMTPITMKSILASGPLKPKLTSINYNNHDKKPMKI